MKLLYLMILLKNALKEVIGNLFQTTIEVYIPSTIQAVQVDKTTGYYDFLLKPTNEKYQSETNAGVRLHLAYLSENEMRWEQTVRVDGKPFVITMNFTKN